MPLTADFDDPLDINTDVAPHRLWKAGVLRRLLEDRRGLSALDTALTIATVRHPFLRAVSSFLYLSASHDSRHIWFYWDRMRISAISQLDWHADSGTPTGFARFLEYLKIETENGASGKINRHFRPQMMNLRPEVMTYALLGRAEDMAGFAAALAAHLDVRLPRDDDAPWGGASNARRYDPAAYLADPGVRALAQDIFAADFEAFDYAPDAWRAAC